MLQQLADAGSIADSGDFAKTLGQDHLKVVGTIKSLEAAEMITVEVRRCKKWVQAAGIQLWYCFPVLDCKDHRGRPQQATQSCACHNIATQAMELPLNSRAKNASLRHLFAVFAYYCTLHLLCLPWVLLDCRVSVILML